MVNDKDFIRAFLDIKLSRICKELHMDSDIKNVYNLTTSGDKLKLVRKSLEDKLKVLYENEKK